ncbi:MAG: ABC transporter substrate-binding protein [Armatimonadetes bacterium]|nr:ABC transporter substrate-binding protein [Armatimonadota bacterium]NIM23972.1 ABC transporter substrate-binding protein [Armatimonadota bacterium]NIM67819.1 ABC transporter substrate-binding protein [Armatimonadota bacterium]NIM76359.1 ABC transporter substrate-binding protein [Armatimonadota bacterium]NIN06053.1 ABC transporter substrate-binding protein [Armatimonadota bacterium]
MREENQGNEPRIAKPLAGITSSAASFTRRSFLKESLRAAALATLAPSALSLLASGCARRQTGLSRALVQGSLRVGLDADVETLDPAMHRSRTVEAVVRNICDGLVARDLQMQYVPQLAVSWSVEGDTRWIFKLREGVRFHTGEPFTAEDVKFTIDRVIGAIEGLAPSPRKDLLGPITGVEVIDEHTVAIITDGPYPILHKKLVFQEICPKAYFERVGAEEFARKPVGTGPFSLVEWRPGERIVLERFEDYYGGSPDIPPVGTAKMRGVLFRPLEEAATRLASLEAKEVDVAVNIPPDQAEHIGRLSHARLSVAQGTRTHFIGLNCTRKPFSDRRVREAMCFAIDPKPIVEQYLLGRAQALPGILVPMAFGYDDSLPQPRQDLARAKGLLKEAGYPQGFDITLDCEATDKRIAEAITGSMRAAGVRAEVRVWKKDNLLNQMRQQQRDMFLTSWGNSSLDPSGILPVLFRSEGYSNYFGFQNAELDRLLEEADRSMEAETRRQKYIEVQRILHREAPTCFHFALEELYGVSDRVENFEARPDGMLPMHDVSLRT